MAARKSPKVIASKTDEVLMPISMEDVQDKIIVLRGEPVILDRDVAELYGVQTKEINQAVKNNLRKFPKGYILSVEEEEKEELVKNFDRFNVLKHSTVMPTAFTERGLYMMATILKSRQAELTTIAIIDTFASVKELARTLKALNHTEEKEEQKGLLQKSGELIGEIIGNDMATAETETELELNFAVLKVKHTIKRKKQSK
jgi:2-oxo-4-hydroxy-4-carboxy--5-ureidoimidazoline (OHCU) decarboxylase